jgi:hypothetical protein
MSPTSHASPSLALFTLLALVTAACVVGPDGDGGDDGPIEIDRGESFGFLDQRWEEHRVGSSSCGGAEGADYLAIEVTSACTYPVPLGLIVRQSDGTLHSESAVLLSSSMSVEYDEGGYTSFEIGGEKHTFDCLRVEQQSACVELVTLQTAVTGHYLRAESGGDRDVNATGTSVGLPELFELFDFGRHESGWRDLENVDDVRTVSLRASSGRWVVAEGGGGGEVRADRERRGTWETFYLFEMAWGTSLLATNLVDAPRFLRAWYGGGSNLDAKAWGAAEWEEFLINRY